MKKYYQVKATFNGGTSNGFVIANNEKEAVEIHYNSEEVKKLPNLCYADVIRLSRKKYNILAGINRSIQLQERNGFTNEIKDEKGNKG